MSSKMLRPLYTTLPWTPTEFYPNPKNQAISAPEDQYLLSPVPQDQSQMATILQPQPQSLSTITYNNLISPLGPNDIPPPTSDMTSQDIHQNHSIYPQYPTQFFTPSPWSSTSQQLLTPQYPFFPSNVFAYPQPQPHSFYQFPDPALQIPIENDIQEHVIPYPYPINTQQNATDDLFQHDQDNTVLSSYSTTPFGTLGIVHQDDMFQSQHEAVLAPSYEYKPSHVHVQPQPFPSRVFDHPDPNSIIIDSSQNHINRNHKSNIFRSGTSNSSSAAEPITIDPKLSSWGNMIMGGEQRTSGLSLGSGTISDRTSAIPVAVPTTPILPLSDSSTSQAQGSANDDAACRNDDDPHNPSPTKRARWSSSKSTTPLRKRRPPQLHLPPPSSNMRVPTTSAHTAPAATISLDLFVSPPTQGHINGLGRRVGDFATILPQEPPKIDGWVSPDERPVPPVGYVVPGWELAPKIFEYDMQNTHIPVVADQPSLEVQVETNVEPAVANNTCTGGPLPPTFQPYEPTCIPRVEANPQPRIPNANPGPPPTPYILVPGVNGFEVVPWRPKPQASPMVNTSSGTILPPTTAAPWEVSSAPPLEPSLPPSTASSWESITSFDGHFPIPIPEAEPEPIINDHRGRGKSKSTSTVKGIHPPPRYYNPPVHRPEPPKQQSVICEICDAYISRTSDLPRHMRKHTGEKPYQCQYCACSYARNDKLSNHIAKNHPGKPRMVPRAKFDIQQ